MKLLIVSVRDRSADVFGQPMFVTTKGGAIRSFGDEVNRRAEGNVLAAHPEDFDLYFLGTYDDSNAMFETVRPESVAVGKDLVR